MVPIYLHQKIFPCVGKERSNSVTYTNEEEEKKTHETNLKCFKISNIPITLFSI